MALNTNMKAKALGKDEVMVLLDLISNHKVITTKATNATNNRLKEEAWKNVAQDFSALVGDFRRPDQLKLKWENLKKAARKRSALIRHNTLKTGGGKSYIPPDENLDRVAAILGTTCTGLVAEFGGDVELEIPPPQYDAVVELVDNGPLPEDPPNQEIEKPIVLGEVVGGHGSQNVLKTLVFNTPKNSLNKRRKLAEEVQKARRDKDLALAEFFKAKAEKIRLENAKLKLEIQNLEHKTSG